MDSRPSVLVVDDEEAILFAIEEYLTGAGWRVATAATPEQVRNHLAQGNYSVAIVDLRLSIEQGGDDGLEVVRRIRDRSPSTRVVVLTAFGSESVRAEARRLGVACLLAKPLPLPELDAQLRELLAVEN